MEKQPLINEDATVVAKAWFPGSLAGMLTIPLIAREAEFLSLPPISKRASKPQALAWFGQELVRNKLVKLAKDSGLTRDDVIKVN